MARPSPKDDFTESHLTEKFRFDAHDGTLNRRLIQNNRLQILEQNRALRNEGVKDMSFMRWALSIPEVDFMNLVRKYPDLQSRDANSKTRAWRRFISSAESVPYRMHDKI